MGITWTELNFDDYSYLFAPGLTAVIQSVTLVRVIQGSKHKFIIKILALLIGYNLFELAGEAIIINMFNKNFSDKNGKFWMVFSLQGIFFSMYLTGCSRLSTTQCHDNHLTKLLSKKCHKEY
jgi:hypothetical protein